MSQPTCGDDCSYSIYKNNLLDKVSCGPGNGSCFNAELLSPMNTVQKTFHDTNLRGATTAINAILNSLRLSPPNGLKLSFLRVPGGLMLAWVEENGPVPADAITPNSSTEDIRRAVGLIDESYSPAPVESV